jgi:pyruvate formate lyase activating enzyme
MKARYWKKLEDGRFECNVCPRACKVRPGQQGFCVVREAQEDGMYLATYGRSSGFCIDPVEKKPLNHFFPGTSILSFGTVGCNLGCQFCQNWDISKVREQARLLDSATPQQIAEAALNSGCKSVAFTYNDPVIFLEYAVDTANECRKRRIKTVAVTAGYISQEARAEFFHAFDAANVDLKAFTEEFYEKRCLARLAPVLETLRFIRHETNTWLELTTLLIPGENDSPEEINRMTTWIVENLGADVPLHFTAFHPDFRMRDIAQTPPASLWRAREIALKNGMKFVYTGNVHDRRGGSTYCPSCGELLIERDWFEIGAYHMSGNSCGSCGQEIPGHFDLKPGTWGSRRVPIRMAAR